MTVIEISEPGDPDVLRPAERPTPAPGSGEVLVKVAAAGVNRPDVAQRLGKYPPPPGASDIPGLEIAGTIEQTGPGVPDWRVGDRVCALVTGGGYAEYCVAPARQCLPVPRGFDFVAAAAIPETFFTVWTNVFERGRLKPGESILIHGGSAEKCAACQQLGAQLAINYRDTDFVAAIRDATGGRGVDVILDMVGGEYVQRNIDALGFEGRLVQISTLGGAMAQINMALVMQRRLTITGSTLRVRSVAEKGTIAKALREHVWPLFESGAVQPVVHATFPLRAAAEAHRLMESSRHIGKLVLVV